jgi:hypothetical protein
MLPTRTTSRSGDDPRAAQRRKILERRVLALVLRVVRGRAAAREGTHRGGAPHDRRAGVAVQGMRATHVVEVRVRGRITLNRPGFFGGLNPREDGADVERNPILPGTA